MKFEIAAFPLALLLALAPALVQAQTSHAAKNTVKKRGGKVVPKTVEEKTPVDDDPAVRLTDADLEVAKRVYMGDIPCELGATVHITPHKREGFFIVRTGLQRFRMHPVESKTGAIRLEDPVAGAMWLQLSNKSMLMSQKMGKRLADDCMNPAQVAVNESLKKNPINILEAAPVKVIAPVESAAAIAGTAASPPGTPAAAVAPAAADLPAAAVAVPGDPAPASLPTAPAATTN
jgi:hypothetical protein